MRLKLNKVFRTARHKFPSHFISRTESEINMKEQTDTEHEARIIII